MSNSGNKKNSSPLHQKKKIIVAVTAAVVILIAIIAVVAASINVNCAVDEEQETDIVTGNANRVADEEQETDIIAENDAVDSETRENGTIEDEILSSESNTSGTDGSSSSFTGNLYTSSDKSQEILFPFTDEENNLVLDGIYDYSGNYIEDGSDEDVESVALLQVTNTSDTLIEYGVINLTADGTDLKFVISLIPAGATVYVMDVNRTSFSESSVCSYEGSEIAYISEINLAEDYVTVSVNENGGIEVTNISGSTISELRLFYKNKISDTEYVGGIAYTVKLTDIEAGSSITVNPSHFDPEYGEVLMVRIY